MSGVRILDRYIIRKFLGTFVYALALIISISIVFDISEKIEDFIDKKAPIKLIVFEYYLSFIPYFANLFSPLFVFISVIFFTSRMAYNTEIVAILAGGISFRRFLRPYMISAVILLILSLLSNNLLVPPANKMRLDFENRYIRNQFRFSQFNIHRKIAPGTFVYFESFNNERNTGYKFSLEKFDQGQLSYKLMADIISWDSIKKQWEVLSYHERKITGIKEQLESGPRKHITMNLHPGEFSTRIDNIESMNYFQLEKFIEEEQFKGSDNVVYYLLEKHRRFAMPFATIVLTLIGVAVASRKVRGGIGLHIGIGLLYSFSYIMFMQVTTTFSTNAGMPPVVAMWIPNIVYLVLALYLLSKAPK